MNDPSPYGEVMVCGEFVLTYRCENGKFWIKFSELPLWHKTSLRMSGEVFADFVCYQQYTNIMTAA